LLYEEIKKGSKPNSIALILDGNRRWASSLGFSPEYGHEAGYKTLKDALNWFWELGVKEVTVYALSTENLNKRSSDEISHILTLSTKGFLELADSKDVYEKGVKVKVIGDISKFSDQVKTAIKTVEERTAHNSPHLLQIALGYGGRDEIIRAVRTIAEKVKKGEMAPEDISEDTISSCLYTAGASDPDVIIRTGGEERLSNFLLWQSSYSELIFLDVYWPQFRKIDLYRIIRTYQTRKRRYGA